MTRRPVFLIALFVTLLCGCAATVDVATETAKTQAAGNDRYHQLASEALAGTVDPTTGLLPVSKEDLAQAPASVRRLVEALLGSLHANRVAAHSVVFQLGAGPDPRTLNLDLITLPRLEDSANDGLLEDR